MKFDNAAWFRRGIQNGVPIALGYLAVSFTGFFYNQQHICSVRLHNQ